MQKFKTVDEFLESLDDSKRKQVELLREIILSSEPALKEIIKWNSPSYTYKDEDRITFNLHNKENEVKLILHMGATEKENKKGAPIIDDNTGLIDWNSDIRGMFKFKDLSDIENKKDKISLILKQWLAVKF